MCWMMEYFLNTLYIKQVTSRKMVGAIFSLPNPSSCTTVVGSTYSLNRNEY
jgi:hypothetical protein